ncbi:TPA: S-layer homology domain-containing protein [Bacillus thuringiensis]|uniref:S-layer-like protein n=40 Tax=Bacillus TaxID=1386 RepID=A0A9W4EXE9_BACTO|nr:MULTISPECIES: S-layer homology domain-containing protein [Bacillus cereus group]KMP94868.1 cell surface protein [Bacillus cereus]MCR6838337.1 S-layer homology domain-containing protein [Bacillus thuringiensis]MDA2616156.1 S-layer homology domain-containing protein [Bacillus cereus]MDQ8725155.1 S-layer homology domain-containing protein [Bacillus thuringiensis serovar aizawai]MDY7954250.1 S-layer homology domain-containing protein [Bacillus thuringiensis]
MANKFLKTATALTIMGTSLLGAGAFTAKAADNTDSLKFNDVPANHWSTKAIYDLTNRKVVQGYGNNIFGFGDNVTRGQVARMIYMYVKPADANASFKNPFTDIKGHLFEKEILALAKAGLVNGFGDGKYGPDDILTREQMAQVLTNAFKFKATKTTSFTDIDKNSWALKAISALEENGVTIGTGGNMYSPYTHVTREQYSQFLYNSINAVEKETKPEVKPDPKPEEKPEVKPDPKPEEKPEVKPDPKPEEKPEVKPDPKPEEKPEVKPDPKPEEKPEVKPDPKPEEKPEVKPDPKPEEKPEVKPDPKPETKPEEKPDTNLPSSLDKGLVTEEVTYNPNAMKNPIAQKSISTEAQNLIKSVNAKYGTNLKYADLNGTIRIIDKNMYLPEGTIGAQVYVNATSENDFKIIFLDNNEATIELAKKWTTMLNSDLVLDKEIQETVDAQEINNYEKGKYKIRVGHSTADHMMYVQVRV